MKPTVAAPPEGVAGQNGNMRDPVPPEREKAMSSLPAPAPGRAVGFPASVAEFLLLFRLRVRRRSALCADMLERAVQLVVVTCKNWFATDTGRSKDRPLKPR